MLNASGIKKKKKTNHVLAVCSNSVFKDVHANGHTICTLLTQAHSCKVKTYT